MSIAYKYHEQYKNSILIRKFHGNINVIDIIESWNFLINHKLITPNILGVINDLQKCNLMLDFDSFETLTDFLKRHEQLRRLRLAVIIDTPEKIVFPMLGENHEKELKIKPFSTIEAATKWIIFD